MLRNTFKKFLNKPITPLSLSTLHRSSFNLNNQNIFFNNKFIKEELSIRLSHRIYHLLNLSYGLPMTQPIKTVIKLYDDSLNKIDNFDLNKKNYVEFSKMLLDIKNNHSRLEFDISNGISLIRDSYDVDIIDDKYLNKELNKFFISRIGIRTLILQNFEITNHQNSIFNECNVNHILQDCLADISILSERNFREEPTFLINNTDDINIHYLPSHIYYILNEVIKNSVIAHNRKDILDKEPIVIDMFDSDSELVIKISDKGDSFSFNDINKVLTYSYSTEKIDDFDREFIIGGFGFGLPLAKVYAKYFKGDIIVNPKLNCGTDVFIYLDKKIDFNDRII